MLLLRSRIKVQVIQVISLFYQILKCRVNNWWRTHKNTRRNFFQPNFFELGYYWYAHVTFFNLSKFIMVIIFVYNKIISLKLQDKKSWKYSLILNLDFNITLFIFKYLSLNERKRTQTVSSTPLIAMWPLWGQMWSLTYWIRIMKLKLGCIIMKFTMILETIFSIFYFK